MKKFTRMPAARKAKSKSAPDLLDLLGPDPLTEALKARIREAIEALFDEELMVSISPKHTAGMIADQVKPAPSREIARMEAVLGRPLLGRLLGVSASTLRRYREGARPREDVSRRARFLALILDDLAGSYHEAGQRLWFMRNRAKLGGRAPVEALAGKWTPKDAAPREVAELARWLREGEGT